MKARANLVCKSEWERLSPADNSCLLLLTVIAVFMTSAIIKFCVLGESSQTPFLTKWYNCSLFTDQRKGGVYVLQKLMWRPGTHGGFVIITWMSIIFVCLELCGGTCELPPSAVLSEENLLGSAEFMVWFYSNTVTCYHRYYQKFIIQD